MALSFRHVATVAALFFGAGALGLLILPGSLLGAWGVEVTPESTFMGRRLAPAFLGFALMLALVRNAPMSAARRAITLGVALALTLVAAIGFWEWARGAASTSILTTLVVETTLAALLLISGRQD